MNKQELRLLYKKKRLEVTDKERLKMDDLLLIQLQKLSVSNIETLFTYWPMSHAAEPNTLLFTRYMQFAVPGLRIAYPVTDFANATLRAVLVEEKTVYQKNYYGIVEPAHGDTLNAFEIDMVFVPLLICDVAGNRIGYGKGFYDRYLEQCSADVLKIGFSYFDPVEKIDDTHAFDIPLNICITPGAIYEF